MDWRLKIFPNYSPNDQRAGMDFLSLGPMFCCCTNNTATGNSGQGFGRKLKNLLLALWEPNVKL
jgi:hypothetical protein